MIILVGRDVPGVKIWHAEGYGPENASRCKLRLVFKKQNHEGSRIDIRMGKDPE